VMEIEVKEVEEVNEVKELKMRNSGRAARG
jgi:hypothetical protein